MALHCVFKPSWSVHIQGLQVKSCASVSCLINTEPLELLHIQPIELIASESVLLYKVYDYHAFTDLTYWFSAVAPCKVKHFVRDLFIEICALKNSMCKVIMYEWIWNAYNFLYNGANLCAVHAGSYHFISYNCFYQGQNQLQPVRPDMHLTICDLTWMIQRLLWASCPTIKLLLLPGTAWLVVNKCTRKVSSVVTLSWPKHEMVIIY